MVWLAWLGSAFVSLALPVNVVGSVGWLFGSLAGWIVGIHQVALSAVSASAAVEWMNFPQSWQPPPPPLSCGINCLCQLMTLYSPPWWFDTYSLRQ